jgi:S1-C subfamily serine protease
MIKINRTTNFKKHFIFISMLVLLLLGCMAPIVSEKELLGLRENARINPDSPAAYHNLGIALYYVDRFQEAVNAFNKSIRLRPDDPETHYNIALAYDEIRDGKNAIANMIKSEKLYGVRNDQAGKRSAGNQLNSYYSEYDYTPEDFGQTYSAIPSLPYSTNPSPPAQVSEQETQKAGTGSGFFVSKLGHVITNAHVIKGCKKLTVGDASNKQVPAEVVNTDSGNDLALLKLSSLEMASAESKSLIQKLSIAVVPIASKGLLRSEDVKLGEKILVAGYPFGDAFSNSIKVTTGVVSSTRGVGDDSGQFQLDAAVQPGNSGGPIYDSSGNIVGVVISQLNKKTFGSLVENVNFGVKASTVRQFLISSGLNSRKSTQTDHKSTEQLAEIAQNQALMVMCLQ